VLPHARWVLETRLRKLARDVTRFDATGEVVWLRFYLKRSKAAELPPIHDDPCDRFIIAAAKLNDLVVVTTGEWFEKYELNVLS
jgi:hypothetical protein